jgi:ABC-type lipoprotein release transport system permease subunit
VVRTLRHYWPIHLAVVLGAAVATAVLAGALLVGDSVRASLRALTLDRLGRIDAVLVTEGFFREALAEELARHAGPSVRARTVAPAVLLQGSATHADSGARAMGVAIHGVDERFFSAFGDDVRLDLSAKPGEVFPPVVLNATLARELGAAVGDALLARFGRWSAVPRETLLGERDPRDLVDSLRLVVRAVIPDRGIGRFGLRPAQQAPPNAFVPLRALQRALGERERVNALLAVGGGAEALPAALDAALGAALRLEDYGIVLEPRETVLDLQSREYVLRPAAERAAREVAAELGLTSLPIQAYVVNELRRGALTVAYSMVAALDPLPDLDGVLLAAADGSPLAPPSPRGVVLNAWTADGLGARVGDDVELTYFVVEPGERLREARSTLRVEGVAAMAGLAADRSLAPEYPGIHDAQDIAAWDPPFPVDLRRVRPEDESYWDRYGLAPKAFVAGETGRRLWSSRFGSTTTMRLGLAPGDEPEAVAGRVRNALERRLDPGAFGFAFRAVKEEGLRAASGATDFGGLFIGFSSVLIVSAALLVGLLFRLGAERRAREIGLLLALGYRVRAVRRRLLAEGSVLAAAGGVAGLAGGAAYAALMMLGLRTLWRPAVGSSELHLAVVPASLALGWALSVGVVIVAVHGALRRLVRVAPPRLLTGAWSEERAVRRGRLAGACALGGLAGALALTAVSLATGRTDSPALAFGTGMLLLGAGLGLFALGCRGGRGRALLGPRAGLLGMAARNGAWNPGRSLLSVALVASACFVIVTVSASRGRPERDLHERTSGGGGFALVAESAVPLHQDLDDPADRLALGFDADTAHFAGVDVLGLRLRPGDDASCLNLYRPERPRLLGVSEEFLRRGGFRFRQHLELAAPQTDPWTLLRQPLGDGVIPAIGDFNSVRWILHLGLGQELTIEDDRGRPLRLRIVALLDHSIFQSELLVSEADFLSRFPGRTGYGYFLIDAAPEVESELMQHLESTLAPFGFDATPVREKLAGYRVVENTYLSTFQVLGGLGLLLGTIGLGVVLIRNVIERRAELAALRAFGFRRSRLAALVLAEHAFLLGAGTAIGSLAALAAVAPRLRALDVAWGSLAATLALVVLTGMASSLAAVSGALRAPLLPALKTE